MRYHRTVQVYGYFILAVGWLFWLAPFLLFRRSAKRAEVDRRARWGLLLLAVAYSMLWQGKFWEISIAGWQIAASILLFVLASFLSWTAMRALGLQWGIDAKLNANHELVTSGPYHFVRHPIYSSMLCVLLATGVVVTPWWLLSLSMFVFAIGTEIRVRAEDRLLRSRFGASFQDYKRTVPAYVPFLR